MASLEWVNDSHNIVDIIHGVIPYTGLEAKIIENTIFARLHRIYQSSLAYLTFPSNKVHRHEHSLGVMHLSGQFFFHSICNSEDRDIRCFMKELSDELEKWLDSTEAGDYLSSNFLSDVKRDKETYLHPSTEKQRIYSRCDLYRRFTPVNLNEHERFLYYVVYESVRLVGLLHDVGHLPYSHITEFALQRLYADAKFQYDNGVSNNQQLKVFLQIMEDYGLGGSGKVQIHEMIGRDLVRKIFASIKDEIGNSYDDQLLFLAAVFYMTSRILKSTPGENSIYSDLHRIVDGVIDSDRMDYCCRDLYCAGVSKELPQYERIFSSVQLLYHHHPAFEKKDSERVRCYFAFTSKALGQIDALLQRRWDDFSSINFHHRVHKHELLLEMTIYRLGRIALGLEPNQVPRAFDEGAHGIPPYNVAYLWYAMKTIREPGAVDIQISQIDDEWMNSLLKYEFFDTYGDSYRERITHHNDSDWNRIDELITGQKHYRSLFKRSGGFRRFDRDFQETFGGNTGSEGNTENTKHFFDERLRDLTQSDKRASVAFYRAINDRLEEWVNTEEAKTLNVIDCCVDENNFSVGIQASDMESIYIVSSQQQPEQTSEESLKGRSNISTNLERQKELFPSFHAYYLPRYDVDRNAYCEVEIAKLRQSVARIMSECLKDMLAQKSKHVPTGEEKTT